MSTAAVHDLADRFERELERPVDLVLTQNRSRLVSWRVDREGTLRLRMHRVFAELAPDELATVAGLVREEPGARERMRRLIESRQGALREHFRAGAPSLEVAGGAHDLEALRDELVAQLFPAMAPPPIGWSGRPGVARRRIRLGSWDARLGVVRIHRCLDRQEVPRFFVASVVNHELCHAALGDPPVVAGRRRIHGPEFRALEQRFPDLARAEAWEREHRELLFRP